MGHEIGYGAKNFGEKNILSPEAVLMLLGGEWPEDLEGFPLKEVDCFRAVYPGVIQGFGEDDEPIGPEIFLMYAGLGVLNSNKVTYRVEHNPNCPSKVRLRLVGRGRATIDGLPIHQSQDRIGHGQSLGEALRDIYGQKLLSRKEFV